MDNTENIEEIKKLFKERGMAYKGDLIESLSEEEFRTGCIKLMMRAEKVSGDGQRQRIKRNTMMMISMER